MLRGTVVAVVLCAMCGCGDDTSPGATDGGAASTSSADSSDATGTTTTTSGASSSGVGETTETSSPGTVDASSGGTSSDTTGDASLGTTGGGLSVLDAEVTLYPQQPMVVDITVSGDADLPADLAVVHGFDNGVHVAVLDDSDPQTRIFRLRGLAPATEHAVTASAGDVSVPIAFTTEAPLPGFVPSFSVRGVSSGELPYRMFDVVPFPDFEHSSLFMIDTAGQTRFHYGAVLGAAPGPDSVFAAAKLREDGTVLYIVDHAIIIQDELGNELVRINDEDAGLTGLHHDVLELDNGNFLALSFSFQQVSYPGNGPTFTAGDVIAEITPQGEVIWQWDSFDALDPQRITEPFDGLPIIHPRTGEAAYDWTHANGIVLSPDGGSVLISFRHQDWLVSIDRETGAVQWRLGVDGDFALQGGEWFFHQHSAEWQADGSLQLYDNGVGPDGPQVSRVVRYALDFDLMEATQVFQDDGAPMTSLIAGDADTLPRSGNILVTDSSVVTKAGSVPRVRELDPQASPMMVWEMILQPNDFIYRTTANDRLVGEAAP